MQFFIGMDGLVYQTGSGPGTLHDRDVVACTIAAHDHLRFPPAKHVTTVLAPIDFQPRPPDSGEEWW